MTEHKQVSCRRSGKIFNFNIMYLWKWGGGCWWGGGGRRWRRVSDVFAEVFSKLDSVHEGSMKAYLGTVARRMAVNRFQKLTSGKIKTISLDDESIAEFASDTDIFGDYEKAEQAERLLDLILSLGEPDASIIIQKYYYDRNSVEIAKITGLNPVAVRMRLSRALKRLRKLLEENP